MKTNNLAGHLGQIDIERPTEEQIHRKLRSAILNMSLPPGALVSETEIGQAVGVSRTPVRAALASLRSEGLIATRPSRGNYVTLLSTKVIREAHFIRDALEQAVATRLCRNGIASEDLMELNQTLARGFQAIDEQNREEFHRLDDRFHVLLSHATGHTRLPQVLEREKVLLDRLRVLSLVEPAHQRELLADHHEILERIIAKDEVGARIAVSRHLARVLTTLTELKEHHSAYFETNASSRK